jgi:hypothetical protein
MKKKASSTPFDFTTLPNAGPATAEDLRRLGITTLAQLAKGNPLAMYEKMGVLDGQPHDICVLDVFTALVEHARTGKSKPWWHYSRMRKSAAAPGAVKKRR